MTSAFKRIARLDAHHRLIVSLVVGAAVFYVLRGHVRLWTSSMAAWDAFAVCTLALAWITIVATPREKIRARAQAQDLGHKLIFVFVVITACAALFAVGFLLHANRAEPHGHLTAHLIISLLAVVTSWSLTHTVFGLRYAHTFYGDSDDPANHQHAAGLDFPGERLPDYLDFAYFSFVIGMTCQVSDVQITSRNIRQLALLHGVLSFGFNVIILALTINTVTALL
jgi:Predicted membrane protein